MVMRKRIISILFLFFIVSALLEISPVYSKDTKAPILWNKEFPGALTHFELLRNQGVLHIVAREKKPEGVKKENWPKRRYLLDSNGKSIWEGNALGSALISDEPYFVILVSTEDGSIGLQALDSFGSSRWKYSVPGGLPVSIFTDPSTNTLYMAVLPYEWMLDMEKPFEAHLISLNLQTGNQNWMKEIGALQGNLLSYGSEMAVQDGILWWIGGRKAIAINASTGELLSQISLAEDFEDGKSSRAFKNENAFASNDHWVWGFSKSQGLLWKTELPKGSEVLNMAVSSAGLVLLTNQKGKVYAQLLEASDGKVIWEKIFKEKKNKFGRVPRGLGIYEDRLVFASGGKIISLKLASGEIVYEQNAKSEAFDRADSVIPRKDHIVMVGPEGAYAYSAATGQSLWEQSNFIDPVFEQRKIKQATLQLAFSIAYSSTSPEASKAWSEYHSGSRSYSSAAMTASTAQFQHNAEMSRRAQSAADSWSQAVKKLAEIDLNIINRRLENRYATFYRHHGFRLIFLKEPSDSDAVLLDLDSGQIITEVDIKKSGTACVSQVLIDPIHRRVYQTFRQMALMCSEENKLNAYQF